MEKEITVWNRWHKTLPVFVALSLIFTTILPVGYPMRIYAGEPVERPAAESKAANSITLKPTRGYQYRMDDGEWRDDNVFTGLQKLTAYTFYQRQGDDESTESEGVIIVTPDHNHEWAVTAEGDTLTAKCLNTDGFHEGSDASFLTIVKPELVQYGESGSPEATITGDIENVPKPGIVYRNDENNERIESAPVNAGTYRAEITVGGATASVTYTIARRKAKVIAGDCFKYKGDKDPDFPVYVEGRLGSDPVYYMSVDREPGEEPGEYTITPVGDEIQGNYDITFVPGKLTIIEPSPEETDPEEEEGDDSDEDDPDPEPKPQPEPEPEPQPEPSPEPKPDPQPAPSPEPAPSPQPAPVAEPAPAPEPVEIPEAPDPEIPSPDLGVKLPKVFRLLRKAGARDVISWNQIVLYAPKNEVRYNGRSHIKMDGGVSTGKKVADLGISVDCVPGALTEYYHYKQNKNASSSACYYISLKPNKSSTDWQALSRADRSALKKALKEANKTLKINRVYFTIQKLDLSEFVFDSTVNEKGRLVFRRKGDSGDTLTVVKQGGKKHYIENLAIVEKNSSEGHIEAYISGTKFRIAGKNYSRDKVNGTVTITGSGGNLTGSMTANMPS